MNPPHPSKISGRKAGMLWRKRATLIWALAAERNTGGSATRASAPLMSTAQPDYVATRSWHDVLLPNENNNYDETRPPGTAAYQTRQKTRIALETVQCSTVPSAHSHVGLHPSYHLWLLKTEHHSVMKRTNSTDGKTTSKKRSTTLLHHSIQSSWPKLSMLPQTPQSILPHQQQTRYRLQSEN